VHQGFEQVLNFACRVTSFVEERLVISGISLGRTDSRILRGEVARIRGPLDLAEVQGSYRVARRSSKLRRDRVLIQVSRSHCISREIAYRDLVRSTSKIWQRESRSHEVRHSDSDVSRVGPPGVSGRQVAEGGISRARGSEVGSPSIGKFKSRRREVARSRQENIGISVHRNSGVGGPSAGSREKRSSEVASARGTIE
jgi:hypothetical protein